MAQPIRQSLVDHDLSPRVQTYTTVDASPAGSTETVIATLDLLGFGDLAVTSGILLFGWAAFTVGTSGDGVELQIKQTDASGTAIAATGLVTETAADLDEITVGGFDAGAGVESYALTMTVHSGAAASAVSALMLAAVVV